MTGRTRPHRLSWWCRFWRSRRAIFPGVGVPCRATGPMAQYRQCLACAVGSAVHVTGQREHSVEIRTVRRRLRSAIVEKASVASAGNRPQHSGRIHGRDNTLVQNASIAGGDGTTCKLDIAVWRRTIAGSLMAPILTCRVAMWSCGRAAIARIRAVADTSTSPRSPEKRATPSPAAKAAASPA